MPTDTITSLAVPNAQETQTTAALNPNAGINYTVQQLDDLLTKFTKGKVLFASDVQTLLSYYSDFQTHTHGLIDLKVVDNFGNLEGDQSESENDATGDPNGTLALPANPGFGTTFTAAKHNEIRNAFNSLRTHTHSWDDDPGRDKNA